MDTFTNVIHEPLGDVLNCPQTVANATLQEVSFSKYKPHIALSKGIHKSNHFFFGKGLEHLLCSANSPWRDVNRCLLSPDRALVTDQSNS